MKKPSKRKYPDAMHEAMDIPHYVKPSVDDGSGSAKKKHEKSESKQFERKEKRR